MCSAAVGARWWRQQPLTFFCFVFLLLSFVAVSVCLSVCQVLPLSLSVDFLRLVLAVVDDHARSQGQSNGKASPAGAAPDEKASLKTPAVAEEEDEARGPSVQHATATCFLSVGDFPRLYNGPGAIMRSLVKACKGDNPSGEVRGWGDRGRGLGGGGGLVLTIVGNVKMSCPRGLTLLRPDQGCVAVDGEDDRGSQATASGCCITRAVNG